MAGGKNKKTANTRVFRAPTWVEAMRKAQAELGSDIRFVSRRDLPPEKGLFSKLTSGKLGMVEIEVAVGGDEPHERENEPEPARAAPNALLQKTYAKALEGEAKRLSGGVSAEARAKALSRFVEVGETSTGIAGRLDEVKRALDESRRANDEMRSDLLRLVSLQAMGGLPAVCPELVAEYRRLLDMGVKVELARELAETSQAANPGNLDAVAAKKALCLEAAKRIPAAGSVLLREGRPTIVALVGATGVGKSTTIAKLAVEYSMRRMKRVGLINEDANRPGADGQMRNLANLLGVSLASASDPSGVANAVNGMSDLDLILLDTAGRSPRDAAGLATLKAVLAAAKPDETHLVLASGSSDRTMFETVARFRMLGFDRLIVTKLDETDSHGCLLNIASRMAEGLSYVTTGQKYTESLFSAEAGELAMLALGLARVGESGIEVGAGAAGGEAP